MRAQLTERNKDHILNSLVIASLVLLCIGIIRPSVPRRTEIPSGQEYSVVRLQPLSSKDLPVYTVLEEVPLPSSAVNSTFSGSAASTTSSATASPGAASGSTSPLKKRPSQIVNGPDTLNSILKIKIL